MEQKGMTFDHDFCYFIIFFFFPLFLGGKRKGENNNQSRGQKSCLSARSVLQNYHILREGSEKRKRHKYAFHNSMLFIPNLKGLIG